MSSHKYHSGIISNHSNIFLNLVVDHIFTPHSLTYPRLNVLYHQCSLDIAHTTIIQLSPTNVFLSPTNVLPLIYA